MHHQAQNWLFLVFFSFINYAGFIKHNNLKEEQLRVNKLHLSRKGNSLFNKNFFNIIDQN